MLLARSFTPRLFVVATLLAATPESVAMAAPVAEPHVTAQALVWRRKRKLQRKSRLENEVIVAVVSLYLFLAGALLGMHYGYELMVPSALNSAPAVAPAALAPSSAVPIRNP